MSKDNFDCMYVESGIWFDILHQNHSILPLERLKDRQR